MSSSPSPRFVSRLTRNTLVLILAGGRGSRLMDLTTWRAKPAVPFGGKFRIIDFTLSNCINSGIRRIGVLTQYKAHSLIRHLRLGWGSLRGDFGEFVEILPAQQRTEGSWYRGTADAVYQSLDIVRMHDPDYVLILAGDHVYKMDYGPMLARHVETGADVTVGCLEVPVEEASAFGVMAVDGDNRVVRFQEKPADPPSIPGQSDRALASMGIYIFNRAFLFNQLIADARKESDHDFGKDIIPSLIDQARVIAFPFRDAATGGQAYWRDVGTIDAFWRTNLELVGVNPQLNLYDKEWPIWTHQEQLPPAKFVFDDDDRRGMAVDSMVSGGCIISGAYLRRSLLFSSVVVEDGSRVEDAVILPEAHIEPGCRIRKAVIDKHCRLAAGTVIGEDPEEDARRFHLSPGGVVLVTPDMLGQEIHNVYT
ncbi:glucose-1-phosphate adenylyltransferase [Alkalilimnicola ehrlichii MLHE-1]|uniref:Glucose-1-phosphate adenylyltransferase 2 n=1 Tax=Alkalilimnicola ehrlichii (strain ATCC BAA-1101 / DSM 17681 / MLHE-1) TaxID=187272 RepID=GLGC2_ALKEH|nr:glucose-1-phosphate adenylyltransferase [Alkalilimnicola ehrlichii]Q0AA25.1 RecName: Full=Glucose-1-phosphate adenylyltransferase 2; AltName: Full=ADP-glucose pyrophosphorylase 2; Short=ADPGlc PPase 2; AltName: Full=ADP-glucose synthase 2 [Alkalilimnicola ehrlichii MLHE-1]ABI56312.1 glucose-1-phosphate adenylyltransferase [Alkalilimnicola ehrlichii MLHE-1]